MSKRKAEDIQEEIQDEQLFEQENTAPIWFQKFTNGSFLDLQNSFLDLKNSFFDMQREIRGIKKEITELNRETRRLTSSVNGLIESQCGQIMTRTAISVWGISVPRGFEPTNREIDFRDEKLQNHDGFRNFMAQLGRLTKEVETTIPALVAQGFATIRTNGCEFNGLGFGYKKEEQETQLVSPLATTGTELPTSLTFSSGIFIKKYGFPPNCILVVEVTTASIAYDKTLKYPIEGLNAWNSSGTHRPIS